MTRFAPSGPLRGDLAPPARQVDQPPRGADRGDGGGDDGDRGLPRRRRHAGDARRDPGGSGRSVEELGPSSVAGGNDLRVARDRTAWPGGALGRGGEPVAIDVGNAGTLLRMLPGWLAGQGAGAWTLDGDESIRRRPVDRVAEPLRLMGAEVDCRDGRLPPLRVRGGDAARDRVPAAGRQRPGQVVPAARRPARRRGDPRGRAAPRLATTPSACWPRPAPRSRSRELRTAPAVARRPGPADRRAPGRAPGAGADLGARRLLVGRLPRSSPRRSCREAACGSRASASTRPASACWGSSTGWAPRSRSRRTAREAARSRAGRSSPATARSPPRGSTATRCRWRSTSCRWSRCSAASPRAGPWSPGPRSCATRSRTGSRRWSRGCAGSAPRSRRLEDGFAVARHRRPSRRGARRPRRPPPGDAGRGRRARLARRRRGGGHGGGRRSATRASRRTWPRCWRASGLALAGVALAGPGGEEEQQARVLGRPDLAALVGVEHRQQPGPPLTASPSGPSISIAPETTRSQARSWTWCSCRRSPAGSWMTIARPSSSESRTAGLCGRHVERRDVPGPHRSSRVVGGATLSSRRMVIAIDGPAGAGKSTVARARRRAPSGSPTSTPGRCTAASPWRRCAPAPSLDDGARWDGSPAASRSRSRTDGVLLDGEDVSEAIRAPEVSAAASRVSVHPEVREAMVERQRALIAAGDYVAEGRDIGTVVSPDAPLKVFLTASDAERARRRAAETGEPLAEVLAAQATAGRPRPRSASTARCAPADDAVEIDTTGLERRRGRRPDRRLWPRERGLAAMIDARFRRSPWSASRTSASRRSSTGWRAAGRRSSTARPGVTRDRKALDCEWNGRPLPAGRHRRRRPGGRGLAVAGGPAPGARGDRRRRRGGAGRRRARRPAPGRRRGRRDPAPRRRPVVVVANKIDEPGDAYLAAEFHRLGLGEPHPGLGDPRPRDGRPARPARRSWRERRARTADAGRRGRVAADRRDRAAERRQVVARQRLPGHRAGDRLRARRNDSRRDRHRARVRRAAGWSWSTPPGCGAAPRSPARSPTTRSFAPSARPSAPTSRSSSATRPRASPPRTCGSPSWRCGPAARRWSR